MKISSVLLVLAFSIYGFSSQAESLRWPKKVLAPYLEAKSYEDLFCKDKFLLDTCVYYKRQLGSLIKRTPLKFSEISPSEIAFNFNRNPIYLSMTDSENQFLLNGHRLDISIYESREQLRAEILKKLSQRKMGLSLWLSPAYAEVGERNIEAMAALEALIMSSQNFKSCEAVKKFIEVCQSSPWMDFIRDSKGALDLKNNDYWNSEDSNTELNRKKLKRQIELNKEYIKKLSKVNRQIKQLAHIDGYKLLKSCPLDGQGMGILESLQICTDGVRDFQLAAESLNEKTIAEMSSDISDWLFSIKDTFQEAEAVPRGAKSKGSR